MTARKPPKHSVIVCHPAATSFTLSVAERYCSVVKKLGHEVVVRDLYQLDFDPVLRADERPTARPYVFADDVALELDMLAGSDVFVFVYPIWFGTPPAMIKGYIDRVLGAGFPYGAVRDRIAHPLMAGKRLVSFTSSGTTLAWLEEQGAWVSLRTLYDKYLQHAFSLAATEHVHFDSIATDLKPKFVAENLYEVEQAARKICSRFIHPDTSAHAPG
ncbi:NAD(P)H-dependent oxidoreductase [soil metagenome]